MTEYAQRLLHESLLRSGRDVPAKVALIVEGKPHTYAELLGAARSIAQALRDRGLARGDRVAIYMDNTFPCAAAIFGTMIAGGVFLVINPQTKEDKLAYIVNDSGARFLFTDGHLSRVFAPCLPKLEGLAAVVCSGKHPTNLPTSPAKLESFESVLETPPFEGRAETISLDLAALIYTSGSTGNPKGVMMTHQSMLFITGSLVEYIRLTRDHRILNVLPLAFDYGLYQLFMAIHLGATLVLERSFTYPAPVMNRMVEHEVTVFPGVPTIYAMLLSMHAKKPLCFPAVKRVTNTAAALPADFIPKLQEIFPNALVFKMYGLTECKRVAYLEPEMVDLKASSVGKAIPGTEVMVLDGEGRRTAPGEVGVLHVRGAHVMLGYWNLPEKSRQMLKEGPLPGERILCTHDWFKVDEDGFLYFVGRSDDIIKTRGEKVAPVEVENVLHGLDGIREAAVIGVPDELLGQAIRAFVAVEPESGLTEKEIKKLCMVRLENFMVPKEVVFLPELPKTPSGKIRKKDLDGTPKSGS